METISSNYEYRYAGSNVGHHHAYLLSPLLEMFAQETLSSQQKPRVLDLGCGNGSLSNLIAKHGYEVVGVEESETGFQSARLSFPDCHFIQASIYDLPYTELGNSFDIVISSEVIEHLLYPRVSKGCKKMFETKWSFNYNHSLSRLLKNIVLALSGKMDQHFTVLWDGGHVKFFSVATMTALLESEGLANLKFKFAGRILYLWKSMLCSSSIVQI